MNQAWPLNFDPLRNRWLSTLAAPIAPPRVLNRFGACDPPFEPKADHGPYLNENKTKTTKPLFPACYT